MLPILHVHIAAACWQHACWEAAHLGNILRQVEVGAQQAADDVMLPQPGGGRLQSPRASPALLPQIRSARHQLGRLPHLSRARHVTPRFQQPLRQGM